MQAPKYDRKTCNFVRPITGADPALKNGGGGSRKFLTVKTGGKKFSPKGGGFKPPNPPPLDLPLDH